MARHRFGIGTYRYYAYQLPPIVDALRQAAYPALAVLANNWAERLGEPYRYPTELKPFLDHCHEAGQSKPTPLILRYDEGGYNALHQDLYGEVISPSNSRWRLPSPARTSRAGRTCSSSSGPGPSPGERRSACPSATPLSSRPAIDR